MDTAMYVDYRVIIEKNLSVQPNNSEIAVSSFPLASSQSCQDYNVSIVLSGLYIVLLFPVGFIGNILILAVNLDHRGRWATPDLYFVNLAVADLVLVADSMIEVFNLKRGYYDNAGLCTFMNLFQQANMYSSVFFLTWMSLDRFVALSGSSLGRSLPRARLSCCLLWAAAGVLTLLPFALAQVEHAGEVRFCFANVTQIQWLEVTLGFALPLCVLTLCYGRIAWALRRRPERGVPRQRPRRRRALRMISAAVLVFFLCWLPENAFISVHLLRGGAGGGTLWQDYPLTGHAVRLAAFSNSCLNPLIYGFLGETFRKRLRLFVQKKSRWSRMHRSASGKSIYVPAEQPCLHAANTPSHSSNFSSNDPPRIVPHSPESFRQAPPEKALCHEIN
ncbi:G-protein coupled estrogen receptor 1-like [Menidia menidia]